MKRQHSGRIRCRHCQQSGPVLVLCLVFELGVRCLGICSDWPHFLGPHSDGKSDETGLIDSFSTNGPQVLWSKKIGTGYSAPSVKAHRLVLHHRVQDEETVECLNVTN